MTLMLAVTLWVWHAVLLLWNLRSFRMRIALVHGLGMALVGGGIIWFGSPTWVAYIAGAVIGAVGGWGHKLAPGLFVGVGLLWTLPFFHPSALTVLGVASFAFTGQVTAAVASLARPNR